MDCFTSEQRNQINVALLGAVSVGKSTLTNAIFAETFSKCKLKKTTMTPQVYNECERSDKHNSGFFKEINDANDKKNANLTEKLSKGEKLTKDDIEPIEYAVPRIHGFSKLSQKTYLSVYDIPGLNDSETQTLFFDYIANNFYKFDIIVLIVDIHSAFNTIDEIQILEKIINNCKDNFSKFGINNKLIVLANKCDDMEYKNNQFELSEDHAELYEQAENIVKRKVGEIFPKLDYEIIPISVEDSYIYRMFAKNKSCCDTIDMKYITKFGYNEFPKSKWKKLDDKEKREKIKQFLQTNNIDEQLVQTGWNLFKDTLNSYLTPANQKIFINNHLEYCLRKITGYDKLDINDDVQKLYLIQSRYKELSAKIPSGIDTKKIFNDFLANYFNNYSSKVISNYIHSQPCEKIVTESGEEITECFVLKADEHLPQIEEAKKIVDNAMRLLIGTVCEPLKTLQINLTNALVEKYSKDISQQSKPVNNLFTNLQSIIKNGFKVLPNIVNKFVTNPDMLNNPPHKIIEHIEKLSDSGLISYKEKMDYILKIILSIYQRIHLQTLSENHLTKNNTLIYTYFAELFWNNFTTFTSNFNPIIYHIHIISKANVTKQLSLDSQSFMKDDFFTSIHDTRLYSEVTAQDPKNQQTANDKKHELLVLENYYKSQVLSSAVPNDDLMQIIYNVDYLKITDKEINDDEETDEEDGQYE